MTQYPERKPLPGLNRFAPGDAAARVAALVEAPPEPAADPEPEAAPAPAQAARKGGTARRRAPKKEAKFERLTVTLPPELYEELRYLSFKTKVSLATHVERALMPYVKRKNKGETDAE